MKDIENTFTVTGNEYPIALNLTVMEAIQDEYKSVEKWGELTDGSTGEPNAKAVIFGFMQMINEGLDIQNEKNGTNEKMLTKKQVGRLITEYGLVNAANVMNGAVVDSTQSAEENA